MASPLADVYYPDYYFDDDDDLEIGIRSHSDFTTVDWAIHLIRAHMVDREYVLDGFGIDEEVAVRRRDETISDSVWPRIEVPHGDATLTVLYRNSADDFGTDFYCTPTASASPIRIGSAEGHFALPALSWGELENVMASGGSEAERAARLLLFLPACWDVPHGKPEEPDESGEPGEPAEPHLLDRALRAVGAAGDVEGLVEALAGWGGPGQWYQDGGVLVCDSEWSLRNPQLPYALSEGGLRAVSEALAFRPGGG